ncbi:hypothetical protein POM88_041584 [Heracleum sosnowskyi]|uniref:Uncharacterized protein n=1 Tax=Heracleum sosnowskyi TaxID=360622 RepID=A0AAD8HG72_9APIA|nr:hypothetical protein POM88_041584 [Heracleum sosnowskyi]
MNNKRKPTWFDNHQKFLPANHPFRKNKSWFTKGKTVSESAPHIRTGRAHGVGKTRYLDDREYTTTNNYDLFNCQEVAPYIEIYTNGLREHNPHINGAEIDKCLESDFAMWFKLYAQNASLVPNEFVQDLASGPLRRDKVDWLVVCKVKARPLVELPQISESRNQDAYQDDFPEHLDVISTDDIPTHLDDIEGTLTDLDDGEQSPKVEIEIDSNEEEFSKTDDSDFYDSDA